MLPTAVGNATAVLDDPDDGEDGALDDQEVSADQLPAMQQSWNSRQ